MTLTDIGSLYNSEALTSSVHDITVRYK